MKNEERHLNSTLSNYRSEEHKALNQYTELLKEHFNAPQVLLYNWIRTVRTQEVTKLLSIYEVFKHIQDVHGSIIEIGTLDGFNLFTLGHFSEIFEPRNYTRQIWGFDTFTHYASLSAEKDKINANLTLPSTYSLDLLKSCVNNFNQSIQFNQFLKIGLVEGDAVDTIPTFVQEHPELVVSMLICHCGMYNATRTALKHLYPRMPKGSVVLFRDIELLGNTWRITCTA